MGSDFSVYFTIWELSFDWQDNVTVTDSFEFYHNAKHTDSWKDNVGIVDSFNFEYRDATHEKSWQDKVGIVDTFSYYKNQEHTDSWQDKIGVIDSFGYSIAVGHEGSWQDDVGIIDNFTFGITVFPRWKDEIGIVDSFAIPRLDRSVTYSDQVIVRDYLDGVVLNPNKQGIQFVSITNPNRVFFKRGREIIIREPFGQRQIAGFTNANQTKIQDYGSDEKYFEIIVSHINESLYDDIKVFFAYSSTKYINESFFFIKEDHTTVEKVRLWKARGFNLPHVKGGLFDVKLLLKREV